MVPRGLEYIGCLSVNVVFRVFFQPLGKQAFSCFEACFRPSLLLLQLGGQGAFGRVRFLTAASKL